MRAFQARKFRRTPGGLRLHMNESQNKRADVRDHSVVHPIRFRNIRYNWHGDPKMPESTGSIHFRNRFEPLKFDPPPTYRCGW